MLILILTILAVTIVIIGLGLSFSPKPQRTAAGPMLPVGRSSRSGYYDSGIVRYQRRRRPVLASSQSQSFNYVFGLMDVRNTFVTRAGTQTPWLGIALVLLAICICISYILFSQGFLSTSVTIDQVWPDAAVSAKVTPTTLKPFSFQGNVGASQALVRINQLDQAQYNSNQEYQTWAYSTCSAASMTEVINAYNAYYKTGKQYRITDILKVETAVHAISPDLGLLEPAGIDRTVQGFGFKTSWPNNPSVKDVINIANSGRPVVVGFPPERWSGGHLLVVRGGDDTFVYLADSSRLNMQQMTYARFMQYWAGFAVVVVPM